MRFGVFMMGLVLALSVPTLAFAYSARFYNQAPTPGSSTALVNPPISVRVYDKYGVTGTHYWMMIDGVKKPVQQTRLVGYTRFDLRFLGVVALTPGVHTVKVRVHDRRGNTTTTSWTFTETGIAPPPVDVTLPVTTIDVPLNNMDFATVDMHATDAAPGVIRTYYKLDGGPETLFSGPFNVYTEGAMSTLHTVEYWSVDAANNSEAHKTAYFFVMPTVEDATFAQNHALPDLECAESGCHSTDLSSIHYSAVDDSGRKYCAVCHNPDINEGGNPPSDCTNAQCHGDFSHPHLPITNPIAGPDCIGCHVVAGETVLTIHGSCATCHGSSNSVVRAAIAAGIVAETQNCTACHNGTTGAAMPDHDNPSHVIPVTNECVNDVCHASRDAVTIHGAPGGPGCAACHDPSVDIELTPDTLDSCEYADCHPTGLAEHPQLPAAHQSETGCAVGAVGCHGSDVTVIHAPLDPGCTVCHNTVDDPSTVCTDCHDISDVAAPAHTGVAAHQLSGGCFGSDTCHAYKDASAFHMGTPSGCAACHTGNRAATVAATVGWSNRCALAGCHPDLDAIHDVVFADFAASSASGHNVNGAGIGAGVKTKFDGSQGSKLIWESEIASAALQPQWVVAAGFPMAQRPVGITSIAVGQEGTVTTDWNFPTVNVFWAASAANAPTGALTGLTKDSVISCFDCHSGDVHWYTGPHGSATRWALDANYTADYSYAELTKKVDLYPSGMKVRTTLTTSTAYYTDGRQVICSKCHDLQNYQSGTTQNSPLPLMSTGKNTFVHNSETYTPVWNVAARTPAWYVWTDASGNMVPGNTSATQTAQAWAQAATGTLNVAGIGSSNTAHSSHHQDTTDGSAQCVSCHIAVTHGWKAPRLLVNTGKTTSGVGQAPEGTVAGDSAPYVSPNVLGSSRANGTPAVPLVNGYNKQGMLTLSAVDNHTLNAGGLMFNSAGAEIINYTTGAAMWSEPSCQGCNEHSGEDGIRIIDAP